MKPLVSVVVSSYNRLPLFRRMLWSLASRPPSVPFELVVADDASTEPTLDLVRSFGSSIRFTFIRVDVREFTRVTKVEKFWNNPSLTANIAIRHAQGELIFQQGNEIISWGNAYDQMLAEAPKAEDFVVFSTTLDVPSYIHERLDKYGTDLRVTDVQGCVRYPLASPWYHSDVTNYLSLMPRSTLVKLKGYLEEYLAGLGKEDSCMVRRLRRIPNWSDEKNMRRSQAVSLHQNHGSMTPFSMPDANQITMDRWREGEALSKAVWDSWDGSHVNQQPWEWGTLGVTDVIRNW